MARTSLLILVLSGLPALAQPDVTIRPTPAAPGTEALGRFLHELGFTPKALSPDVFQVTVDRERWAVHIMLSLSTDGRRVWLESKFAPVEDPDRVSPQAWRRLLEANEKIGPAHFTFDKTDRRIHLYKSFEHQALTAARLKAEIEHFDRTVRATQDYWRGDNFKPVIAASEPTPPAQRTVLPKQDDGPLPPLPPFPVPPGAAAAPTVDLGDSERLLGEWEITELHVRGQKTPDELVRGRKPGVTFRRARDGDPGPAVKNKIVADLRTGPDNTRTVWVSFEPTAPVKRIDFTDTGDRAEQGIYKLDGDTLTLVFASRGAPRPQSFENVTDGTGWTLVLKRR
jgi:uncharacterized protein (TIGR03067 family)